MRWSGFTVAAALTVVTAVVSAEDGKGKPIMLSGCVNAGGGSDTFMTHVSEIAPPEGATMPTVAHGRRVLFWLDSEKEIKTYGGRMVEVRGRIKDLTESEVELKAGKQKDGRMMLEFEGPGKDVKVSNDSLGTSVGTAGRLTPNKNDIKTMLVEVHVDSVRAIEGSCP